MIRIEDVEGMDHEKIVRWHLRSDRGHHNYYKNVWMGREMMRTDYRTITRMYPDVQITISYDLH